MADVNVRILSADDAEALGFAKISEFESSETVNVTDYLLVSGYRESGQEVTRRVRINDIFDHYGGDINRTMNWFIPVVRDQTIHWEFHALGDVGEIEGDISAPNPIMPISLVDAIGDATDQRSGLLNPSYKVILDSLGPATTERNGLMSSADKAKLNGIENNANYYVLPTASTEIIGGIKIDGRTIVMDNSGTIRSNAGVPDARRLVIPRSAWNSISLTQKVAIDLDVSYRNTVDVEPSSVDLWINHRVYAISEASDGITFRCDSIPTGDIVIYIISSMVNILEDN